MSLGLAFAIRPGAAGTIKANAVIVTVRSVCTDGTDGTDGTASTAGHVSRFHFHEAREGANGSLPLGPNAKDEAFFPMPSVEILASIEAHGNTVTLRRRGTDYDVVLGSVVLLSSAALETERTFGELPKALGIPAPRRILVGGLGFGATALGALSIVGPEGKVLVVEKLAPIVAFLKGPVAHLAPGLFEDPRLELVEADVYDVIARESALDAILLDVDNGPGWASFRTNARLYSEAGLDQIKKALAPGGALAVWSGYPADAFVPKVRAAGLVASIVPLHEKGVVRARAYVGRAPEANL